MAWYVFALVDQPPARPGAGLRGRLTARRVPGGFALVERRADVPPPEFGTLEKHQQVLSRVAGAVPAILPVRFGTLMEMDEIEEALQDRDAELADAFEAVRARVQFTWRRGTAGARDAHGAAGARDAQDAMTGAAYLKALAAKAAPPVAFRNLREKLRPLIVAERYQAATASLPDALYHLVDRGSVRRYTTIAERLAATGPALRVSGPFPPFAFTPELL